VGAHELPLSTLSLVGLAMWFAMIAWSVTDAARSTQPRERIAWRRRLVGARGWFAHELRQPAPRLQDAWYPWLLALGLGRRVDRWFRAFGGEATVAASASTRSSSDSMTAAASGSSGAGDGFGGFRGFAGGGGFSGGGGGAAFGAAIGGMAASISPPSSSSGSSSGSSSSSSGGSSGGGGGGGW
ncbi:MAG: hypothetical protein MUF21_07055, partial [Gemmatimonadaceae bacterium]|nr:hypothetical protein [Gemmatimonadaceae bacterium]